MGGSAGGFGRPQQGFSRPQQGFQMPQAQSFQMPQPRPMPTGGGYQWQDPYTQGPGAGSIPGGSLPNVTQYQVPPNPGYGIDPNGQFNAASRFGSSYGAGYSPAWNQANQNSVQYQTQPGLLGNPSPAARNTASPGGMTQAAALARHHDWNNLSGDGFQEFVYDPEQFGGVNNGMVKFSSAALGQNLGRGANLSLMDEAGNILGRNEGGAQGLTGLQAKGLEKGKKYRINYGGMQGPFRLSSNY